MVEEIIHCVTSCTFECLNPRNILPIPKTSFYFYWKKSVLGITCSPVVRTLHFHCGGHRFDPCPGNLDPTIPRPNNLKTNKFDSQCDHALLKIKIHKPKAAVKPIRGVIKETKRKSEFF